ncbi:MAG TPA: hypothetical protein VMP11_19760 [Verrucomicrobiae bacterium]|nr:hypothetical protein [Verrucomicrobiae bacterium]
MKNANVFVDVDPTLVDAKGRLFQGAREALQRLKNERAATCAWSNAGVDYARAMAAQHQLTDLFEGFAAKPDIIIDDMPSTATAPFLFNVQDEASWQSMVERILAKHID